MARVEYRHEWFGPQSAEAMVAELNHLGEQGWQAFHMDRGNDGVQVWLSREAPITAAGLRPLAAIRPVTGSRPLTSDAPLT